ncbi:MAG TPA: tetratricopeptide repeat protein [Woeseiaceae bacterium]|nr:tetratricopeptide repeat protein [Woeseiaceae bacterium]
MLWSILALLGLIAAAFVLWPFARDFKQNAPVAAIAVLLVTGLAAGIYAVNGRPDVPSGASVGPDVGAMVESLARRLGEQPDDVNGWKMLGRSYMTLGNFTEAAAAYEKAVALEDAQVAQTLVDLGVALARAGNDSLSPRAIAVFDNAVALAPGDPEALFWGGIAAASRSDTATAADRWERLLETGPPAEVESILTERIALWRGGAPPSAATEAGAASSTAASVDAPVVTVDVTLSDAARAALPAEASVFVIARDPAAPSPPIAVARRRLSELPASVPLGDRDAMIPGRNLSAFANFEVVVRASGTGDPIAASGDWFGAREVTPAAAATIAIEIGERVP